MTAGSPYRTAPPPEDADPLPPCGTRAWLLASLSRLLFVDETRIRVDESTPMVARVTVDGCSLAPVALACAILQEEMPVGVTLTAEGRRESPVEIELTNKVSRIVGEVAARFSALAAAGPAVILHEPQGLPVETPPAHLALLAERTRPPERDRTAAEFFAGKGERFSPATGWKR